MAHTIWRDLPNPEDNWLYLPGGNEPRGIADEAWMQDCIQTGSRRLGDYTTQETLGGPWDTNARDCAINHALFGDQGAELWDGSCEAMVAGLADLETTGNAAVAYHYSDNPVPFPGGADTATMVCRLVAYGVWAIPLLENLPPRGVLPLNTLDPYAEGVPLDATGIDIEFEADHVDLGELWIADGGGTAALPDPDARYAVNYNRQPGFDSGGWLAWSKGLMPGAPLTEPAWVQGPGDYSLLYASEAVDIDDKTFYQLAIPADGFDSLAQTLTDAPDYTVAAGPAEAFGDRTLSADRTVSTQVFLRALVVSPRYRWIYDGADVVPPQRIYGRPGDIAQGAARVYGDGSTYQSGPRVWGGIL